MSEHSSLNTDSSTEFSSLETWDYFVELECLKGSTDLQLAAELGKTLLERNKELELCVREQQTVIDDQLSQIQHLGSQCEAVRHLHDSRLSVYEQLELGTQQLESENARLHRQLQQLKHRLINLSGHVQGQSDCYRRLAHCVSQVQQLTMAAVSHSARSRDQVRSGHTPPARQSVAVQCTGTVDFMAETVKMSRLQRHLDECRHTMADQTAARLTAEQQRDLVETECERLSSEVSVLRSHLTRCCRLLSRMAATVSTAEVTNATRRVSEERCAVQFDLESDHQMAVQSADDGSTDTNCSVDQAVEQCDSLLDELATHCTLLECQFDPTTAHHSAARAPHPLTRSLSLHQELMQCCSTSPDSSASTECEGGVAVAGTQTPIGWRVPPLTNQHLPEYRRLFNDLFRVLKRSVSLEQLSASGVSANSSQSAQQQSATAAAASDRSNSTDQQPTLPDQC